MPTVKLQALHEMTVSIVRNQGKVNNAELVKFFAAGYGKRQLMEVVLGVSHKVMSNYINHIAETPLDEAFVPFEWSPTLAR